MVIGKNFFALFSSLLSSFCRRLCSGSRDECLSLDPVHLELEVISLQPRAFVIEDFLNDFEADEIVSLGNPSLHRSSVGDMETGNFDSNTRTSLNTWLSREKSHITDTLYRRAADLLQIDESHLTRSVGAEDIQVVHYVNGQKYDSHHDWGVSGYPESRFITLLLYLNDVEDGAGGETAFPKAANGKGIKVHPGKGSAVLFYDLLEDGNGDDLSLHAALPILKGEKWLANFWVWDPKVH
jgi:prolyl 4-hydroxylase